MNPGARATRFGSTVRSSRWTAYIARESGRAPSTRIWRSETLVVAPSIATRWSPHLASCWRDLYGPGCPVSLVGGPRSTLARGLHHDPARRHEHGYKGGGLRLAYRACYGAAAQARSRRGRSASRSPPRLPPRSSGSLPPVASMMSGPTCSTIAIWRSDPSYTMSSCPSHRKIATSSLTSSTRASSPSLSIPRGNARGPGRSISESRTSSPVAWSS